MQDNMHRNEYNYTKTFLKNEQICRVTLEILSNTITAFIKCTALHEMYSRPSFLTRKTPAAHCIH